MAEMANVSADQVIVHLSTRGNCSGSRDNISNASDENATASFLAEEADAVSPMTLFDMRSGGVQADTFIRVSDQSNQSADDLAQRLGNRSTDELTHVIDDKMP